MRKIYKIIFSICFIVGVLAPQNVYADKYRVISIRGCTATINNNVVHVGDEVPENAKFNIQKTNDSSLWVVKLQSISTGKIHPLCSTTNKNKSKDNSDSWLSWFWNNITGQKKCSTRAPENELTDGLVQNLSQTFYLPIPYNSKEDCDIDFATNLSDSTHLVCEYMYGNESYTFDIPIIDSKFTLSPKFFDTDNFSENRTVLRIIVKYVSETGEVTPITDSMNIILIKEDVRASSFINNN